MGRGGNHLILIIVLFSVLFLMVIGLFIYMYFIHEDITKQFEETQEIIIHENTKTFVKLEEVFEVVEGIRDYNKVVNEYMVEKVNDISKQIEKIRENDVSDIIDEIKKYGRNILSTLS